MAREKSRGTPVGDMTEKKWWEEVEAYPWETCRETGAGEEEA